MIEIVLLGAPRGKERPRLTKTGHVYTPQKTRDYEAALKYAAMEAMGDRPPLEGPLQIEMVVKLPIAQSWPKKRQQAARDGLERPTKKPDYDNFAKVVDALNLIVWVDDAQVVDGRIQKFYSDKPGMWITVRPLEPTKGSIFE
jgi:Holliday junction resolvase RusA-like endonuclease